MLNNSFKYINYLLFVQICDDEIEEIGQGEEEVVFDWSAVSLPKRKRIRKRRSKKQQANNLSVLKPAIQSAPVVPVPTPPKTAPQPGRVHIR